MSVRDNGLYLSDMWDAITSIQTYIGTESYEEFVEDDMTYDAVMRQLTILGEAANNLKHDFQLQHPEIPWSKIIGMRNRLMHEYSDIENDIVWNTCKHDLPALKKSLEPLVNKEN